MRTLLRTLVLASLALPAAVLPAHAQQPHPRTIVDFDPGWTFLKADAQPVNGIGPESLTFDDSTWRKLSVPHDWSIEGPFAADAPAGQGGAFLPTGIGWYRHRFTLPETDKSRHAFIVFDGVMANSDVWINGFHLGHRPNGYVSFFYDLTGHLNFGPGATNVLAVRADTAQQPASRWYAGSGIYRPVRLVLLNDLHAAPWSTVVSTPRASTTSASVHFETTVTNDAATPTPASVAFSITGPDGRTLTVPATRPETVAPHASTKFTADLEVPHPALWDLDHPSMYRASALIQSAGKPLDNDDVPFGIREFHFDPDHGFFLNGHNFKIKGAALHGDVGGLGVSAPPAAFARRLLELRALGVNAIRTAHNPPSPQFLDLCDQMGFLVMDEFFDQWTVAKNPFDYHLNFTDWALRDEADTIRRDRNHPSIILWSVGNEIHDTPQQAAAFKTLTGLVNTAHENDPTRPVTQALFRPNVSHDYDNGLADLLDVVGQNYREQELLAAHAQKPTRKILGTENTHDRNQWLAMRDHPEWSGSFLWAGADYLGESGRWPRVASGSGLIDRTGGVYARGFERQAWWLNAPVVHIARRVAPNRTGSVDPGYGAGGQQLPPTVPGLPAGSIPTTPPFVRPTPRAPQAAAGGPPANPRFSQPLFLDWNPTDPTPGHAENVEVYTNAEEVDLLLNGKSLGREKLHADASPITYKVPFAPGTLTAIAYTHGKKVAEDILRTAGPATAIRLTPERPSVNAGPDDALFLDASVVDAAGTVVPDASTELTYTVSGARILAADSGNGTDHDAFQTNTRKLWEGHGILVLAADAPGPITVTATAPNSTPALSPATATARATPTRTQPPTRSF